jgi:hypothetical protein
MLLEVQREASANGCTLGTLSVDGVFECFTLEAVVREIPGLAVVDWKIPDITAIPSGTYQLVITASARFHKLLPELVDVPGFAGVRIHCGNRAEDTEGCILVGRQRGVATILESRIAFTALFPKIKAAFDRGESMQIRVTNPALALPADAISRT